MISGETDKSKYYGKMVTGYTPKNSSTVKWKIFYADSNNIYLIADNYVETDKLPAGTNENNELTKNKPTIGIMPRTAYFGNELRQDYKTGSARIIDSKIKKLNNDYFNIKKFSSVAENMKGTAYLLDTKSWESFKDRNGMAEFAIGGPTIEMILNSYNQKYNAVYKAVAESSVGYKISVDNGNTLENNISKMLNENDSLYVIKSKESANVMWISSPSAAYTNSLLYVGYDGSINYGSYDYTTIGFRPVVCLSSSVELKKNGNDFSIK